MKTKRLIALMLSALMILSVADLGVFAAASAEKIVWEENFDKISDAKSIGGIARSGDAVAEIVPDADYVRSLRFANGDTANSKVSLSQKFSTLSAAGTISFSVKYAESNDWTSIYFDKAINLYLSNGAIGSHIGTSTPAHSKITAGEWHDVEVDFDVLSGKYDVYVDYNKCGSGVSMRTPGAFSNMSIVVDKANNDIMFDNFRITSKPSTSKGTTDVKPSEPTSEPTDNAPEIVKEMITAANGETITLAKADTYVTTNGKTTMKGYDNTVTVTRDNASAETQAFFKFDAPSVPDGKRAYLNLYLDSAKYATDKEPFGVYAVDNAWDETLGSGEARPVIEDTAGRKIFSNDAANSWVRIDITEYVARNSGKEISLSLRGDSVGANAGSVTALTFDSREGVCKPNILVCDPIADVAKNPTPNASKGGNAVDIGALQNVSAALSSGRGINMYVFGGDSADIETYGAFARAIAAKSGAKVNYINKGLSSLGGMNAFVSNFYNLTEDRTIDLAVLDFADINDTSAQLAIDKLRKVNRYAEVIFVTENPVSADGVICATRADVDAAVIGDIGSGAVKSYVAEPDMKYNLKAKDEKDIVDFVSFDNFADGDIGDGILFDNQRDYLRVEDDSLCGGKVLRYKKDTARGAVGTKWFGTSLGGNLRFDIQMCFYSPDTKFSLRMFPTARDANTIMDMVTFSDGSIALGGKSLEVNMNQWYNFALLYDFDTHTYDVLVDGAVFVEGVQMKQYTGTICSYEIDVAAGNTADFAIDSMRTSFYTDAEKPVKEVVEETEDDGPAVIFDNDLESTVPGLISQGTSGDVSYVREDGNTFVRATRTKGTGSCTTNFAFPKTKGDVILELDFRLGNTNSATKLLYLNDANGLFAVPIYFSGDKMQLNLSEGERPVVMSGLEAGRWYHVQIITDLAKQTYSVDIDGATVSPDGGYALLRQPVEGFSSFRISISAGEDSSYDVDNFHIQRLNTMQGGAKKTAAGYNPNNDAPKNNEWINTFRRNPSGEIYEAEDMQLANYEVYKDLNFHNEYGVRVAATGCGTAEFVYNGESGYKRIDVGYLEEDGKIDSRFYLYQNGKLIDWWLAQNDEVGRYNRNSKDYWYVNKGDRFMIRGAYGADPSELDYVEFTDGAKRDFRFGDLVGDANRAPAYWLSSGWDADNAGGVASQGILLRDTSANGSVTAERRLTGFCAPFVIEYNYQQYAASKYKLAVGMSDGKSEKYPVSVEFDGYDIIVGGKRYADVMKHGAPTFLRIAVDTDKRTYSVVADSVVIADGAVFDGSVSEFNLLKLITDKESESYFRAYPFAVKAGYVLLEDFRCESADGIELYNWTVDGKKPTYVVTDNAENCDPFHRGIPSGTAISKKFDKRNGKITYETQILFPEIKDGARVAIGCDGGEIALFTKNGGIWYDAGGGKAGLLWDKYKTNVWYEYKFEIDLSSKTCDFFVNSFKKISVPITLSAADTVKITAGSGDIWVDDIAVFDGFYNDDNEVPDLEIPEGYGDYNIVMQTCDMWREGTHFGYDALHPFAARTPFLGYHEEGNPEACDWETKWMVEHGVNVFAPCWYMPNDAMSAPKNPRNGYRLDQGFMNSKFHDDIKYCINLTYAGVNEGEENFLKYYVPYWIEHYFKDPSYFVVDNKPVIFIFNVTEFSNKFGNDGTAAVFEKIREACRADGFDGAIFAITRENATLVSGWDYSYAYTFSGSEDGYTALQNAYDNENNKFIFTASQGFGAEAWGRYLRKQTLPVKDFRADLEWARDVYMPANADDPLLGNTISLDNWNEYCEGHTLAPSNHAGFEYLDMIREVFTKAPKEHTDVIPEKRFDQMSAMLW